MQIIKNVFIYLSFLGIICWNFPICAEAVAKRCRRSQTNLDLHLGQNFGFGQSLSAGFG
jgi:hypothetical protein